MITKISFVGDLAFFPRELEKGLKTFDLKEYEDLSKSDLFVGNFEFPFSKSQIPHSESSYSEYLAPLKYLDIVRELRLNIVTLGNNHILDWGIEGITTTKEELERFGIRTFGAGINEKEARKPLMVEKKGIKFGFLNYCKKGLFSATRNSPGAAVLDLDNILDDIKEIKEKVNHVILILHWGVEFAEYPFPDDKKIAHKLIDNGVSCIIGHHPHVVQGLEIYKNKPIFYSLGSFIYNPFFEKIFVKNKIEERLISIAVKLEFNHDSILRWEIIPYKNRGETIFPTRMNEEEKKYFNEKFKLISVRIKDEK